MASSLTLVEREPLRLREHGDAVVCARSRLDVGALARTNKRWKTALGLTSVPLEVEDTGDMYLVKAKHVTGIVRVGDLDIEIAPKFLGGTHSSWQAVLWRILATVEGGLIDDVPTSAQPVDGEGIPDLLADIFLASLHRGTARGLPRQYREEFGTGPMIRGSLDVARTSIWLARPWAVPYRTDVLSEDTVVARLLRWAADLLVVTVSLSARRRALLEVLGSLDRVGRSRPGLAEARRIQLGVQHRALQPAVDVAVLLLEGQGVHHTGYTYELSGFLWNSDEVYERFVYWLCQRAANISGAFVSKRANAFGEVVHGAGSALQTTPDVVFRNRSDVVLGVLDAKYKTFGTRPKAPDTYQILTAAHVLETQRVGLTYPTDTDGSRTVWRVPSELGALPIEMTALPLNLMIFTSTAGRNALVSRVAEWLARPLFT